MQGYAVDVHVGRAIVKAVLLNSSAADVRTGTNRWAAYAMPTASTPGTCTLPRNSGEVTQL